MKKDDENQLVGLFNGAGSGFVTSMQNILEQNQIPSVHISGGYYRMPRPTGIRVRKSDFDRSMKIYKEYKAYYDQSNPKESKEEPEFYKAQRIAFFIFIGIVAVVIVVVILTEF